MKRNFIFNHQPAHVAERAERIYEFSFSFLVWVSSKISTAVYVCYVCCAYVKWLLSGCVERMSAAVGYLIGPRMGTISYPDMCVTLEYYYREQRNRGAIDLPACGYIVRQKLHTGVAQQIVNGGLGYRGGLGDYQSLERLNLSLTVD